MAGPVIREEARVKLLVVDWDYFFPDKMGSGDRDEYMYDWGHKETKFFIDQVWESRASNFFMRDLELPGTSGEEEDFWQRVSFNPGATLYYGDSNAWAASEKVSDKVTEVLLLDAHHDSGYRGQLFFPDLKRMARAGWWTCDDWMVYYACQGAQLTVRYPRWKTWAMRVEDSVGLGGLVDRGFDDGAPIEGVDRVYVCRSGAWVPPWLDHKFIEFVNRPSVAARVSLESGSLIREFDLETAKTHGQLWKSMSNGEAAKWLQSIIHNSQILEESAKNT